MSKVAKPHLPMRSLLAALCLVASSLLGLGIAFPAHAAEADEERLQITDPYIELRTGAGRGYPVFHVAARNEWISIELRRTDWYKVRTASGKVGWVSRAQLQTTLTEAGVAKGFRDLAVDDYLLRRVDLGAAWGMFDSEPMLKIWSSYKLQRHAQRGAHLRPGAGHLFGCQLLADQPARRALVGPALLALCRHRLRSLRQLPQPEPGGRRAQQRQPGQRRARRALLPERALCRCAPTSRFTPFFSPNGAPTNTTPSVWDSRFSSERR